MAATVLDVFTVILMWSPRCCSTLPSLVVAAVAAETRRVLAGSGRVAAAAPRTDYARQVAALGAGTHTNGARCGLLTVGCSRPAADLGPAGVLPAGRMATAGRATARSHHPRCLRARCGAGWLKPRGCGPRALVIWQKVKNVTPAGIEITLCVHRGAPGEVQGKCTKWENDLLICELYNLHSVSQLE